MRLSTRGGVGDVIAGTCSSSLLVLRLSSKPLRLQGDNVVIFVQRQWFNCRGLGYEQRYTGGGLRIGRSYTTLGEPTK